MPASHCHHIKEDGVFCQSPALRGRRHCHFHFHAVRRNTRMAQEKARQRERCLVFPPLVDMHAVQAALQQVMNALLADRIDVDTAGRVLYGLQQAASSLRRAYTEQGEDEQEGHAGAYPGFEPEFDLPLEMAFPEPSPPGKFALDPELVKQIERGGKYGNR